MGVHDRTHPGQLLASERQIDTPASEHTCGFCGTAIGDDADERVDHVLSNGESRVERYCSPGCFVRQMEQIGGIE